LNLVAWSEGFTSEQDNMINQLKTKKINSIIMLFLTPREEIYIYLTLNQSTCMLIIA